MSTRGTTIKSSQDKTRDCKIISLDCSSLIAAKSNSQHSNDTGQVQGSLTELGSEALQRVPTAKFGKYLAKKEAVKKLRVDYCSLYETIDRDIREFNRELDYFNKKNKAMFDRLVQSIEQLITSRFPGKSNDRPARGGLRELQDGTGHAVV